MKEKIIAKTLGQTHPFNSRFKFYIKQHALAQELFKVTKILTIVPYATNFSFTNNSKFTYTLANVFISRLVVIFEFYLRQAFNNNATLTGSQSSCFEILRMGRTGLFSPGLPPEPRWVRPKSLKNVHRAFYNI